MGIGRRDDWLTDAQGRALAGAQVYYCAPQPANTSVLPPSPLATIYSDLTLDPATNPQITDGFGHAIAYMDDTILYTLVYVHPLFGSNPIVLPDQAIGGPATGGGGGGLTPFAQIPAGTVDGTNTIFTLSVVPVQAIVWLNFPLVPNLGFTLVGNVITYAQAPQPASGSTAADAIYCQGSY